MNQIIERIKYAFAVWRYETYDPWFKKHKDNWFFRYLEGASWFRWYGRRIVYVKPKDLSKLSVTEKDVKDAINAKDYQKALDIVETLPHTAKTVALKQVIQAKLQ